MRLYRRLRHLKMKRIMNPWDRKVITWASTLKPGDIFGACTGFNHTVADATPMRRNIGKKNGWFIDEVRIIDTTGRYHWAPGGGCVCFPYTYEEILKFVTVYSENEYIGDTGMAYMRSILASLKTDKPFITPEGFYVGPPHP